MKKPKRKCSGNPASVIVLSLAVFAAPALRAQSRANNPPASSTGLNVVRAEFLIKPKEALEWHVFLVFLLVSVLLGWRFRHLRLTISGYFT